MTVPSPHGKVTPKESEQAGVVDSGCFISRSCRGNPCAALAGAGVEVFADFRQRALGEVLGQQGQQRAAEEREVGQQIGLA